MSQPIYESITHLRISGWNIRVWRSEEAVGVVTNDDLEKRAVQLTAQMVDTGIEFTREFLLNDFSSFVNVSAVEVVNENGVGCLVYTDWP